MLGPVNVENEKRGMTGPTGCLTLARWAGRSAGQVGRYDKCLMR